MPEKNTTFKSGKHFSTATVIEADDKGKLPEQIQMLPVGLWNTEYYGPLQVTAAHISQMSENFKAATRKMVPIDVDHDGGKAAGWVTDLIDKGEEGLFASVEWTKLGKELLGDKIYKLFSPEFSLNYVDPEHGTRHGAVMIAGSLTNRPLFKELPSLMANDKAGQNKGLTSDTGLMLVFSETDKNMPTLNLTDIRTKAAADLSQEEKDFLAKDENKTQLTPEEKTKLGLTDTTDADKAAKDKADADAKAKSDKEAADKAAADKAAQDKANADAAAANTDTKTAKEQGTVTISAADHARFQAAAKDLEQRQATDTLNTYKMNDKGTNSKLTPAAIKEGVGFYLTCNDAQKASFVKFIEALPEVTMGGEQGDKSKTDNLLTATQQFEKIVDGYKANDKLNESEAQAKAEKEHPAIYKKAMDEMKGNA